MNKKSREFKPELRDSSDKLLRHLEEQFMEKGGFTEKLYKTRQKFKQDSD